MKNIWLILNKNSQLKIYKYFNKILNNSKSDKINIIKNIIYLFPRLSKVKIKKL